MVYTTNSHDSQLDLDPWIGQRQGTFRWVLVDGVNGQHYGEVHPDKSATPTLTHDTSRTIKRQISSVLFTPEDSAIIDTIRHRIHLYMDIANESYPLGTYAFIDDPMIISTAGNQLNTTLVDEMILVDQELDIGFAPGIRGFNANELVLDSADALVRRLLQDYTFEKYIESTEFYSIGSWSYGTSRTKVLEDLALDGDYFSPWFGNDFALHMIRSFDPALKPSDFDWDTSSRVIRDSIVRINDLLSAPNRFVVVSNRSMTQSDVPVVGIYDIPISAPHSITNRGFVSPKVLSLQVDTIPQAVALAANIGQRQTVFERVELSTPPDPRHDSYNVVYWQGENWLELSWALPLIEGSEMRHVLRKAYV